MSDVLLHVCCAPCSIIPVSELRAEGLEPVGWFENPNIQPRQEYEKRLEAALSYSDAVGMELAVAAYKPGPHLETHSLPNEERCRRCYGMRLEATARRAADAGLAAFTTTLLYSPYQKRELILEAGREAAATSGVSFLERDWRPSYREGVEKCRELGIYRQKYCGCLESHRERFGKLPEG